MKTFDFLLRFNLPRPEDDPEMYIEALYKSGCDDALIGIGRRGRVALDFCREAQTANEAVISAIKDVTQAIPGCQIIEACPDLVGLTEIAKIMDFSRQNMRKLTLNNRETFPDPIHDGKTALWHLATVLDWFKQERSISIDTEIVDIANTTMQLNISKQAKELDPGFQSKVSRYL